MVNINKYYVCWLELYILIYVTWVCYCELKWWYGMNWWIISEYWWCDCYVNWLLRNDELKWMWKTWFGNVIDLCLLLRMMWLWKMLSWEMRYWNMLMMKEWFELLRLWIWNLLNWIELMNYMNCLCLMVMSWLFKWLINMW